MAISLLAKELDALRKISTPTICDAIDTFNVRPRDEGCMTSDIRCLFPDLGVMVGYAVTARIMAGTPPIEGDQVSRLEWWDYLQEIPKPRVLVFQDLDRTVKGAYWDEQSANVQKALGGVGIITDGAVRDVDAIHDLGLHVFASHVLACRAYVHLVKFGVPVRVGGLAVSPGDLLHGDKHGITVIPSAIAAEIPSAVARVERQDRQIVELCQSPDFSLPALKERWKKIRGVY